MCNCGCGKCETKSTALVLNESKAPRAILSEGLKYHLDNNKPLIENVYKAGSRKYFDLFAEARSLYSRGILEFTNKNDIKILTETNLGHFGISDGKRIPLDYPIKEGTFNTDNHVATFGGNDGYAEVYKQADGSFYIVVGGDQDYDMTATDAKDVAAKLKRDGYTRLQAGELNEELQKPMPQDTPNEFAYLDFKKWAYLKRGKIKKQMQSLQGDGSRIFRAMALVWETWANHKAKEWSKITDPNKFGRALVVMMVKDNLVFDKAAWEKDNKITHIKENDSNVIDMDRVFMKGKQESKFEKGDVVDYFGREGTVRSVKFNVFDTSDSPQGSYIYTIAYRGKPSDSYPKGINRAAQGVNTRDLKILSEREVGNKINKARAKAHFKMGEKIAVVHKVTKNVMPIEDIRQIDTFDTNKYDFAYLNENKLLKQDALSPAEYQKAKKLKGFDPKNYLWDKKQGLHLIRKMSEGKLNEDRFGHPITAQSNQMYIQISKLIDMLSGEEKRDVQNAFKVFMDIVGPAKEEEEQKSKFKKTGERSGFDMRGINEEGESWGLDTRRLADSFTFDELEQLYNDKKISKEDLNGAKSYLQSWIDQHPTYLPQRDLTSPKRQVVRDKYLNENKENYTNENKMKNTKIEKNIDEDITDDISKAEDEAQAATQTKADAVQKVADARKKKADAEKSSLEEDSNSLLLEYIKERGDSNLMEHIDKYRKRALLMEGATQKLFKLFNMGKTDAEVRNHYLQMNIDMPESFVAKLRSNWESLRKTKLDLTLADKEAEGFNQLATPSVDASATNGMEPPMEEKQLASGLKEI